MLGVLGIDGVLGMEGIDGGFIPPPPPMPDMPDIGLIGGMHAGAGLGLLRGGSVTSGSDGSAVHAHHMTVPAVSTSEFTGRLFSWVCVYASRLVRSASGRFGRLVLRRCWFMRVRVISIGVCAPAWTAPFGVGELLSSM